MSAQFILTYRGQPVRFHHVAGKSVYELVTADRASLFVAESEAWWVAHKHSLSPQFCDVINAHTPEEQPA